MIRTSQSRSGVKGLPGRGLCVGTSVHAFTLVELLVVIAILAILAALLLPVLSRAKASAYSAVCKSNLRQLGVALSLYVDEWEEYPGAPPYVARSTTAAWLGTPGQTAVRGIPQLAPCVLGGEVWHGGVRLARPGEKTVLHCPAKKVHFGIGKQSDSSGEKLGDSGTIDFGGGATSPPTFTLARLSFIPYGYGYNTLGTVWRPPTVVPLGLGPVEVEGKLRPVRGSGVRMPSEMIAIADSWGSLFERIHPYPEPPEHPTRGLGQIHNAGANAVFCDGHVEYQKFRQWTEASDPARRRWNNDHEPHPATW